MRSLKKVFSLPAVFSVCLALATSSAHSAYAQEEVPYAFDVRQLSPYKGAPEGHVGINDVVIRPVDTMGYLYGVAIGGVFTFPYVVSDGDLAVSRIFYGKDSDAILIRAASRSGNGCQHQYAFIKVPLDGSQAVGSRFFGTCARLESIKVRGNDVMIVIPDGFDRLKKEDRVHKYTYELDSGVMKDNGNTIDMSCHTSRSDAMCYAR